MLYKHGFFAQKVLPLVYDESLSYYEILCKLTKTLNDVINEIGGGYEETVKAYIEQNLAQYTLNASYTEGEERIYLSIVSGDGDHVYNRMTDTITVVGR